MFIVGLLSTPPSASFMDCPCVW